MGEWGGDEIGGIGLEVGVEVNMGWGYGDACGSGGGAEMLSQKGE